MRPLDIGGALLGGVSIVKDMHFSQSKNALLFSYLSLNKTLVLSTLMGLLFEASPTPANVLYVAFL